MPKCLDPDQDPHSVCLDLSPNCLQRLSADDKRLCAHCKCLHEMLPMSAKRNVFIPKKILPILVWKKRFFSLRPEFFS